MENKELNNPPLREVAVPSHEVAAKHFQELYAHFIDKFTDSPIQTMTIKSPHSEDFVSLVVFAGNMPQFYRAVEFALKTEGFLDKIDEIYIKDRDANEKAKAEALAKQEADSESAG